MAGSTTLHFMIEAKYGAAIISGGSKTNNFKQVILNFGTRVEILSGGGINKPIQPAPDKPAISIENKSGVPLTVTVMLAEKTVKGVPFGFYNPLVLEGKINHPLKSASTFEIKCFHPVTKALECSLTFFFEFFSELP